VTRATRRSVLLGIVVVGVAAIVYGSRSRPPIVKVALVSRGRVEATVANTRAGTVKAKQRAKLAPTTSGRVTRLAVWEGDTVDEGAVLIELWHRDLEAQLDLARNSLEAAEARWKRDCLNTEEAEREAQRQRHLHEQGVASEEAVDRAVTAAEAGQAACAAGEADVEVARSQIEVIEAAIERTFLVAPFAGVVAEVNAELGEIVSPSPPGIPTPPAIELIDVSHVTVSAPIDEVDAPGVRTGMTARIHLDAFPGKSYRGTVLRVAPYVLEAEKQARTVEVEVAFADGEKPPGLLPGYSADVEIILSAHEDTLSIPTQAIAEGDRVLVLPEDGIVVERSITVGLRIWERTEDTGGLT